MSFYKLEPRITFDGAAALADLGGSTANWSVVLKGDTFDPVNDTQAGKADTDLVGDANHATLYTAFDDGGTATESDDVIGFRLRIGNDTDGAYTAVALIGVDVNGDGAIDVYMSYDGRQNGLGVTLWQPGAGLNLSPSSSSITNGVAATGQSVSFVF